MPKRKATQTSAHKLIVSDAASPNVAIPLKAGMRFEIVSVTTVDDKLLPTKLVRDCAGDQALALPLSTSQQNVSIPTPQKGAD